MKPKDERALLLQAYGGKCMNGIAPPAGNNDYPRYYEKALEHMQQQMIS